MEEQGYSSYHGMVAEVNTAMKEMESLCEQLDMKETKNSLHTGRKKLTNHKFSVGFMGEFKRGKSTVINALLGQEIMPADILACTATMNRVTYDLTPHAEILLSDGSTVDVPIDQIKDYVTKLTKESEKQAESVDEAIVYFPCPFCQNSVDIVDTPGLNDDDRMNRISEQVIPKLDAVIMVVVPGAPFGKSEADFVRTKLMASDLGRLMFLVNKIDTIRPKERDRCVQDIRSRIRIAVLDKMKEIYGSDSDEYKDAEIKMGDIRVFPISAADALDGRLESDEHLVEESGILTFEDALKNMLTVERGALELAMPLAVLTRSANEVVQIAKTRENGLQLNREEFSQRQQQALQKIKELRAEKKQEIQQIRKAEKNARAVLLPTASAFYQELEQKLYAVIEQTHIDESTLSTDAGKAAAAQILEQKVNETMQEEMSHFCERTRSKVMEYVGKEAERMSNFAMEIGNSLEQVRMNVSGVENKDSKDTMKDIAVVAFDAITNGVGLFGLSGAIKGYQLAGAKGAAVGLGVGVATTIGVACVLAPLGIVGLPLCFIGGLAAQKAGGLAVKNLFKGSINHKVYLGIIDRLREGIREMMSDFRRTQPIDQYVTKLTEEGFGHLCAVMEEECEKVLRETEMTISQIQADIAKNELQKKQDAEKYSNISQSAKRIMDNLLPVLNKVNESRKVKMA